MLGGRKKEGDSIADRFRRPGKPDGKPFVAAEERDGTASLEKEKRGMGRMFSRRKGKKGHFRCMETKKGSSGSSPREGGETCSCRPKALPSTRGTALHPVIDGEHKLCGVGIGRPAINDSLQIILEHPLSSSDPL